MNPITQTGIKGFLVWFAREQPHLYNKIAPTLPKVAPKAFGNFLQQQRKLRQVYNSNFTQRRGVSMGRLADYMTVLPEYVATASAVSPISVSYESLATPISVSPTVDYTASLAAPLPPVDFSSNTFTPVDTSSGGPVFSPVTQAANSGISSTPIANAIAQTVGAASSIYLTNQQAQLQQQVVQSQLQRAAAGLPPLNTSLNQLGIPTVGAGASFSGSSGMVVLGIGAILLVALMSGGSKKSV